MPMARISLLKGKPQSYVKALSDGVHRAMVEAFHRAAIAAGIWLAQRR